MRTSHCHINLRAEQLDLLPFRIDSASLKPAQTNILNLIPETGQTEVISLCDDEPPVYIANLQAIRPNSVEPTPEVRRLLARLPKALRELLSEFPREKKKAVSESMAILTRRQRISRGMFAPLILWPDGSVYKEELPKCAKRPRYIYTTPDATGM